MSSCLSRLIVLCRHTNFTPTLAFFNSSLSLPIKRQTDTWAELICPKTGVGVMLQTTEKESLLSAGYSPIVQFEVDDMDAAVQNAITNGGILDGPIKYKEYGKVAQFRVGEGGVMVGMFEVCGVLLPCWCVKGAKSKRAEAFRLTRKEIAKTFA